MARSRVVQLDPAPVIPDFVPTAEWRKHRAIPYGSETRWRDGPLLHIVTKTVKQEGEEEDRTLRIVHLNKEEIVSACLPYAKLKACCKVVQDDDDQRKPWDDCDGWEHELESYDAFEDRLTQNEHRVRQEMRDTFESAAGVFRHDRESVRIVFNYDLSANYDYERARGASKQVARELAALEKQRSIAQLLKWYSDGWEWWGAACEWGDFSESLWGIDSEDYAWEVAYTEMLPSPVQHVEALGYLVTDKPRWRKPRQRKIKRERLRRQLNSQNWGNP